MRFCKKCEKILIRKYDNNVLSFYCVNCKLNYEAKLLDNVIISNISDNIIIYQKYKHFIKNSGFDPTILKISKICENCGLDYMTMCRLGASSKIIYTCSCLNVSN
jgi:hypothetical protein